MVTEISCMKMESPTLVAEWYVHTYGHKNFLEIPDQNLCHMQAHGLLQVYNTWFITRIATYHEQR